MGLTIIVIQGAVIKFLPFESKLFGNMIDTAHRPGVASEKPPNSKSRAFKSAESFDSGISIGTARRVILAFRRSQRRYPSPIKAYKSEKKPLYHFCFPAEKLRNILLMSDIPYFSIYPQYSVDFTVQIRLLATMTISIPTGSFISASL